MFSNTDRPCARCYSEYKCLHCTDLTFPNAFALAKHLRKGFVLKHHNDMDFYCDICDEAFLSKLGYIDHLKQKGIHKYDLHQAACCGRFEDVGQLIHCEAADVTGASHKARSRNVVEQLGMTPMHCAAFSGYSSCLKVMLSWPDGDPNKPDELDQTPVHLAARCGHASSLRLLLNNGGKLDLRDKHGETPIKLASGYESCMDVILDYQISVMISKYRLKAVVAKRGISFESEMSAKVVQDEGSSGSESSLSEAKECSHPSGNFAQKCVPLKRNVDDDANDVDDDNDDDHNNGYDVGKGDICRSIIDEVQDFENQYAGASSISATDDGLTGQEIVRTNTILTTPLGTFSEVSSEMLPYEILARGEHAVKAFKTAVAEGTAPASRLKVIVVGEVNAGKTSLTRSLCGDPFVDARKKTRGIQTTSINDPIIRTTKLDESWKHADPDLSHYDELIAGNVTKELRTKLQMTNLPGLPCSAGESDLNRLLERLTVSNCPGLKTPSLPIPGSQERVLVTEPSVPVEGSPRKLPATLIARKLSSSTSEISSVKKIIWDFAGHQLYEPMHHVFMNSTSVYLVVFNFSKMSKSRDKCLSRIHYWLNSIASHTLPSTPVIIVGTHREQVDPQVIETAKECCEKKFANLFGKRLVRSLDDEILFAVENSRGQDDDGIRKLKNAIATDLTESTNFSFVNQEFPLKWLHCEEEIIELQKDPDSKKCFQIGEVRTLLENKCQAAFTDREFNLMLAFFHDIGLILLPGIMHDVTDESLGKDLVILSPQYLVDIMACIHEAPQNRNFKRQFSSEFQTLRGEGRVACNLLEHLWKDKVEEVDVLVELLSRFNLLYPLHQDTELQEPRETAHSSGIGYPTKEYIIPCMLKEKCDETLNKQWLKKCGLWKDISDTEYQFVFDFGCFLPPPLFDYLLVHIYRHSYKTKGMKPTLQRRAGIFSFSNKFLFSTKLVQKYCQIWVHARCKKGEHFLHLASILKKKVSDICRQYFKFLKFICGPPCPREDCPGTTCYADEIPRLCESSSSESEKSSESSEDETESCKKGEVQDVPSDNKSDDLNERRPHVIPIDPESFVPPYWCGSVELTECLKDWNPESSPADQGANLQGLKEVMGVGYLPQCCVEECCITSISNMLGNCWQNLARQLGVPQRKIDNISADNPEQKEKGFHVVLSWKNDHGNAATMELLINALNDISRKDLAHELVKHCQLKHFNNE